MATAPTCPAWRHRAKGKKRPVMVKHGAPDNHIQRYRCPKCGRLKVKRVYCWFGLHRWKTRIRGRKLPPSQVKCSKCGERRSTKDL